MNEKDLINFRIKLSQIQEDVLTKILDTDLLIAIYSALEKSPYFSIHEMSELAFKIDRVRMNEIIEGKKISLNERKRIVEYLGHNINWPTIKDIINRHIVNSITLLGKENAHKYLGISLRTQQRYLQNIEGNF